MADIDVNREITEVREQYKAILERIKQLGTRLPGGMELVAETCHGGQFCHGGTSKTLTLEDLVSKRVPGDQGPEK